MRPLALLLSLSILPTAFCADRDVIIRLPDGATQTGTKWALVIGIDGYPDSIGRLDVAAADARRFARCLVEDAGYPATNVHLLTDAGLEIAGKLDPAVRPTYTMLQGRLAAFTRDHQGTDTLVVFFAGHGFHSTSSHSDFIAPLDVQPAALEETAIKVDRILSLLRDSGARQGLLIVDACRNRKGRSVAGDDQLGAESLLSAQARGVWYLASCKPGQISQESTVLGGGLYAHYLVEGLRGPADGFGGLPRDGLITVSEAAAYAEHNVEAMTRATASIQTPCRSQFDVSGGEMVLSVLRRKDVVVTGTEIIVSHLGDVGPAFRPGMTPQALGWGPDEQAYPERFVVNPPDGAEMVWVPAGTFVMGTAQDALERLWKDYRWDAAWKPAGATEHPHPVRLSAGFWLYRHEVTNAQYARFLLATGHRPHSTWAEYRDHERLPVNSVTHNEASTYAAWAGAVLPTEARWEWAARGPANRLFAWGDRWSRTRCNSAELWAGQAIPSARAWRAWYEGIGAHKDASGQWHLRVSVIREHLKPVGSFPQGASWCGALDMTGNVAEWCADWYDADYYASSPTDDPLGPTSGAERAIRGGSWGAAPNCCRAASRLKLAPTARDYSVGLRCVIAPSQ